MTGLVPNRVTEKIKLRKEIEEGSKRILNVVQLILRTVELEPLNALSLEEFKELRKLIKAMDTRCFKKKLSFETFKRISRMKGV